MNNTIRLATLWVCSTVFAAPLYATYEECLLNYFKDTASDITIASVVRVCSSRFPLSDPTAIGPNTDAESPCIETTDAFCKSLWPSVGLGV